MQSRSTGRIAEDIGRQSVGNEGGMTVVATRGLLFRESGLVSKSGKPFFALKPRNFSRSSMIVSAHRFRRRFVECECKGIG